MGKGTYSVISAEGLQKRKSSTEARKKENKSRATIKRTKQSLKDEEKNTEIVARRTSS